MPVLDQYQEPDPLDSSEATIATIGLTPFLSGDLPYIGVMKAREILDTPKTIQKLSQQLVADELPRQLTMPRPWSWQKMYDTFTKPIPESRIEYIQGRFADHIEATQFLTFLGTVYKRLSDMLPVAMFDTCLGQVPIQPSGDKLWAFYSLYWVISDPLIVLTLAQSGALLPSQVEVLSEFYPTLLEQMKTGLLQALVKHKLENRSFISLPTRADRGVNTLLGNKVVPAGSNKRVAELPQQPSGPVPSSQPNKAQLTPGQKAADLS
jgi:hypothetical protein